MRGMDERVEDVGCAVALGVEVLLIGRGDEWVRRYPCDRMLWLINVAYCRFIAPEGPKSVNFYIIYCGCGVDFVNLHPESGGMCRVKRFPR